MRENGLPLVGTVDDSAHDELAGATTALPPRTLHTVLADLDKLTMRFRRMSDAGMSVSATLQSEEKDKADRLSIPPTSVVAQQREEKEAMAGIAQRRSSSHLTTSLSRNADSIHPIQLGAMPGGLRDHSDAIAAAVGSSTSSHQATLPGSLAGHQQRSPPLSLGPSAHTETSTNIFHARQQRGPLAGLTPNAPPHPSYPISSAASGPRRSAMGPPPLNVALPSPISVSMLNASNARLGSAADALATEYSDGVRLLLNGAPFRRVTGAQHHSAANSASGSGPPGDPYDKAASPSFLRLSPDLSSLMLYERTRDGGVLDIPLIRITGLHCAGGAGTQQPARLSIATSEPGLGEIHLECSDDVQREDWVVAIVMLHDVHTSTESTIVEP